MCQKLSEFSKVGYTILHSPQQHTVFESFHVLINAGRWLFNGATLTGKTTYLHVVFISSLLMSFNVEDPYADLKVIGISFSVLPTPSSYPIFYSVFQYVVLLVYRSSVPIVYHCCSFICLMQKSQYSPNDKLALLSGVQTMVYFVCSVVISRSSLLINHRCTSVAKFYREFYFILKYYKMKKMCYSTVKIMSADI